jgi:hypothetical protein
MRHDDRLGRCRIRHLGLIEQPGDTHAQLGHVLGVKLPGHGRVPDDRHALRTFGLTPYYCRPFDRAGYRYEYESGRWVAQGKRLSGLPAKLAGTVCTAAEDAPGSADGKRMPLTLAARRPTGRLLAATDRDFRSMTIFAAGAELRRSSQI